MDANEYARDVMAAIRAARLGAEVADMSPSAEWRKPSAEPNVRVNSAQYGSEWILDFVVIGTGVVGGLYAVARLIESLASSYQKFADGRKQAAERQVILRRAQNDEEAEATIREHESKPHLWNVEVELRSQILDAATDIDPTIIENLMTLLSTDSTDNPTPPELKRRRGSVESLGHLARKKVTIEIEYLDGQL